MTFHDPRPTEGRNPRSAAIDLATPLEIVDIINTENATVAPAVATQRLEVAMAIETAETTVRRGGRLLYVGAGTSGRLGVLDASEMPPTFGTDPEMVQGIIAGGSLALTRSQEGAEDRLEAAVEDLDARQVSDSDFVVGIAASGSTPYVLRALAYARRLGARTALIACGAPPDGGEVADILIVVPTGPEVVTGSTRMKAGTATKMVLNTITTGAMIRLGKTYGNLMVDLHATNDKLRDRSERIIMEVCGLDRTTARQTLAAANGSVKTAIVMQATGLDVVGAASRIVAAQGRLREAIGREPPPIAGSE